MSSEHGRVEPSLTGSEHVPIMRVVCFYALTVQSRTDCRAAHRPGDVDCPTEATQNEGFKER